MWFVKRREKKRGVRVVVCEYNGSIVDVYEMLESFGSVIVICECCGWVMNMYGVLKSCGSVIVVCGYNRNVVDVYEDKLGR